MNWGYAANGFLDGFERGTAMRDRRKQRELQAAAQEFDKEQQLRAAKLREEQFTFDNKRFEQSMDLQNRTFEEQLTDNAWGREFKLGQAGRADALQQEKLKFDREVLAAREREAAAANSTRMQGQIMGQLQSGIDAYRARPREQAETERIMAQAEALRAKSAALAGGTEQPAGDPMAAAYQGAIDAEKKKIAAHQLEMAGGDNRTGLFNWKSRQSEIDDATAKIGKLRAMQGGGAPQAQPGAQLSPQDQQALAWAKANPNDPRATAILQRLGAR